MGEIFLDGSGKSVNRRNLIGRLGVSLPAREVLVNRQSERNQKMPEVCRRARGWARVSLLCAFCAVLVGMHLVPAPPAKAGGNRGPQDKDGAGLTFSKQATSKEVGLPVYPGAKPHKEEKDDSPSVQMGIWGSKFGIKLAVMKMESNDAPD